MWDHVLHLALLGAGITAFFVVPIVAAIPISAALGLVGVATFVAVNRSRRLPAKTGNESLAGDVASVVEWNRTEGLVRHRGELWTATASGALPPKARVRIVRADGTVLRVRPEPPVERRA